MRRVSQPHRCNDRVEDAVQAFVALGGAGPGVSGLKRALANVVTCLRSDAGAEPTPAALPYVVLTDGTPYVTPRVVEDKRFE